jgi:phenylacetate-CoA ligase
VRYNIHDVGHVMRYPELKRMLAATGIDVTSLERDPLDLPLLFLYGRSDGSVSYYGCKVPPADVQEALFRLPVLARHVDAFQLNTFEDAEGDKRFAIRLEVSPELLAGDTASWSGRLLHTLGSINQDFRASRAMAPAGKEAAVEFHLRGTGPFEGTDRRIKLEYVRHDDGLPTEERCLVGASG